MTIIQSWNIDFSQKSAWVTSNHSNPSPSLKNFVRYLSGEHPTPVTFTNCVIKTGLYLNGKAKFVNCYLPKSWEGKVDSENCTFNQDGEWFGGLNGYDENLPAYNEMIKPICFTDLGENDDAAN